MSTLRYILASLWHHRRVHAAVAAGVAVATAVITGALLVGDSVRGSLRDLALERLGRIDSLLVAEQPFREELARELSPSNSVAPLLILPGTLTAVDQTESRRATQLSTVGATPAFWQFGRGGPPAPLASDEAAISQSVADELGVQSGDEVLLRVPMAGGTPADSVLGEKADTTAARRLTVAAVLPDEGLARFSLRPSQLAPRNVFVALPMLQRSLDLPSRANVLAIGGTPRDLRPTLEDFNIDVDHVPLGESDGGYVRITADRLVLPSALVDEVRKVFPHGRVQPAITYLANTIQVADRQIPYSTITGIDSIDDIGPLLDADGQPIVLADDEISLNDWAANDLDAEVGDEVTVTFYEPETTHGVLRERVPLNLRLKAIVPLVGDDDRATAANDAKLTPELPGVTDQRTISDWDLPFELVEPIRRQDEEYWEAYTTTPKAFVSFGLAERLWTTRWGTVSVLRIPASSGVSVDDVQTKSHPAPSDMGMNLVDVRRRSLEAARGTTAFTGLFLGFSFFLMASAVMLIALLFRLGAEGRAGEVGLLAAVGWSAARLRSAWLAESALVAVIGASLGVFVGIGYARLMIHGLTTWWVAATVTPFLELHVAPTSLAIGFAIGMAVALVTIVWTTRKLLRLPARQLLAGDATDPVDLLHRGFGGRRWMPAVSIAGAVALGGLGLRLQGEAQAGAFFGSGALVLAALLVGLSSKLRESEHRAPPGLSLVGLAARNARRNPGRTILSVGLAAVASFLIVALSAFRLTPTDQGTGGFDLIATSDQPIHFDLNRAEGRRELGFADEKLTGIEVHGFRVRAGEDASCLNLYQTSQPRVLGVPKSLDTRSKFAWAGRRSADPAWQVLDAELDNDDDGREIVPIVLDKNTAAYSLHLRGVGSHLVIDDGYGQPVTLEVVGLLAGSVLQGNVLMSEGNFLRLFPDSAGQQLFLIRQGVGTSSVEQVAAKLESRLEDYGFDAARTDEKLADFLAVQNTYLSTFQSLGALGLLLGTVGLAVAQLRSVVERRGELALLRSIGFRGRRLAKLVLGENAVLLLGGLAIGCAAALVAVAPHWWLQEAGTPWATLALLLVIIVVTGLMAGWLAVRAAMRAPLLPALRGD